ncbi:MAG: hypothetical protein C4B57_05500 [Deltaproteobacteria bacterium]|nr:MAG: hypothetical protein C4B57_05500 [Deltaproteobacteria bacterium]
MLFPIPNSTFYIIISLSTWPCQKARASSYSDRGRAILCRDRNGQMLKTSERATWFFSKYAPGPEISKKPFSMALTMASEPKKP